jgi:maltose alpha-D-glucosyltransferase/alpha-amylase
LEKSVSEWWFKEAVIYCADVETFQDSDGDGRGDLPGLTARLDYLARLGVTCLWLNPIHPTPNRDDGYDVADYYDVDPRLGSLGDFVEFVHQADNRGLRVIIDLVVNHTSIDHPWFQSARRDRSSPYRDWYVWSDTEPPHEHDGVVFPGVQEATWTYDDEAAAWYHHRFYDFEPDLNWANERVRREIAKVISFWLQLGVSGFRMDAAPFVIEDVSPSREQHPRVYGWLNDIREHLRWRQGDAVILAEANVGRDELLEFFGDGNRLPMLFNFGLNQRTFLGLARGNAAPLREALQAMPTIAPNCTWATFLRNHDEVDLSGLSDKERDECFAAFGPKPEMQLYGRGIRRRLAPMLDGDRRWIELAYALQFSLPGTPVLRYGEEIGMGDDHSLPERNAIRTPMQWSGDRGAGFSTAEPKAFVRPVLSRGKYRYQVVNVDEQRGDDTSLLAWFERMLRSLRECPEIGAGTWRLVDTGFDDVLGLLYESPRGRVLVLANLGREPRVVDVAHDADGEPGSIDVFANRRYDGRPDLTKLELDGLAYRWLRLYHTR